MSIERKRILFMIKKVFLYVFPILKLNHLTQLLTSDLINLDKKSSTFKSITTDFMMFFIYFLLILTGFRIPLIKNFHAITSPVFGATGRFTFLLASFAVFEVILVRIWIYLKLKVVKSSTELAFAQLIFKVKASVEKKILFWLKVSIFQSQLGGYACCQLIDIIEFVHSTEPFKVLRLIFWSFCHFHVLRKGLQHTFILIAFTFAGLTVLLEEINEMKQLLNINFTKISTSQLIHKYLNYLKSVEKLNLLTKYLLFIGSLFNILFMSLVLFFISVPNDDFFIKIIRILFVLTIIFFSSRVYILTAILSKVDSEAKKIYSEINSILARNKVKSYREKELLIHILEDLSSPKNHFVIKEYNSKVTEMDTFNNIVKTLSIVSLFFASDKLVEKFMLLA